MIEKQFIDICSQDDVEALKVILSKMDNKAHQLLGLQAAIKSASHQVVEYLLFESQIKLTDNFNYWLSHQYDNCGIPKDQVFKLLNKKAFNEKLVSTYKSFK